jgi:hypothetical protein
MKRLGMLIVDAAWLLLCLATLLLTVGQPELAGGLWLIVGLTGMAIVTW